MKRQHFATAVLAASLSAFLAGNAQAGIMLHSLLPQNLNSTSFTVDGVGITVTSTGGNFKQKTVGGFTATGISGGAVDAEIDNNEYMLFTFDRAVNITLLSIAHLYTKGNYGDLWNEDAKVVTSAGTFDLIATGATTGSWNGLGTLVNDSPGTEGNGGAWTVSGSDIFGAAITSLKLKSGNPGSEAKYGDFGFRELQFNATIPGPGGLAIVGLFGLMPRRRR